MKIATPKPVRRRFLAALGGALAAPAAAAPAIAAKVEPEPVEAPELVELGKAFRARLATYREAAARLAVAREHYERIKPAMPDELILKRRDSAGLGHQETDIDGETVWQDDHPRWVYSSKALRIHIINQELSRHTKEGRRLRRLVRPKAHEAAMDAAAREAGYWEASDAASSAAGALADLTHKLLQVEPVTQTGARFLAEACTGLWEARDRLDVKAHTHTSALGVHLAGALLRITGGALV